MSTALNIITRSYRLLGVGAEGEPLDSSLAANGLESLNAMLGSWSLENLLTFQILQESFPLVVNTASYTIGSGGAFNTTRPIEITSAFLRDSGGIDYPLYVLSREEYDAIGIKTLATAYPQSIFYQPSYPLGVIYVYSVPESVTTLFINSRKQLQSFALLTTAFSMPPGYEHAVVYNLAPILAPEVGVTPSPLIISEASNSKTILKRANIRPVSSRIDTAITGPMRSNIFTG